MRYELHLGDNREVLRSMPSDSVDSIVCDPPYELGFMGKRWDSTGIAYDVTLWAECLRVLKPGGHLLAFGGSRTYHRLAVAIEDAGFEIRDCIMWLYASGFPKSHDVSKALDKQAGAERTEVIGTRHRNVKPYDDDNGWNTNNTTGEHYYTAPATDLAKQWQGWGTALKPAHEPIVVARKPLQGTVADNVQAWGVGALNIDGCRIETTDNLNGGIYSKNTEWIQKSEHIYGARRKMKHEYRQPPGRWPANIILDEEAAQMLDEQSGVSKSGIRQPTGKYILNPDTGWNNNSMTDATTRGHSDSGGASRFFFTVKNEYTCPLCYNTYVKDMTTEELCESISVSSAENRGWTTLETTEFIAHVNALLSQNAQLVQNAKSAIPLCGLCAISIAVVLAETKTWGFSHQKCERILDYMPKYASSILTQSLASFAELWVNTDIIPTTQSLMMLYGYALHATENYIKQESKVRVEDGNGQDRATRFLYNAKASKAEREAGLEGVEQKLKKIYSDMGQGPTPQQTPSVASPRANHHPTVKPIALMRYLVRMVTPRGGVVLDPFMGSGTTGCAAMLEAVRFIGIDITPEYVEIADRRIQHWASQNPMEL